MGIRLTLKRLGRILAAPFEEIFFGLDRCLVAGARELLLVFFGLAVGWWVYVPLHELLHALGCLATGGEVSRLEVGTIYGGEILARWIPWVVSGGDYAGRLAGFSTQGNDLIYLATDLAPYLLTLWPGLWAMRVAARRGWSWLFGAALPWALAPFISLTGDAYEIGSILVTRLPLWSSEHAVSLIRGDDIFLVPGRLQGAGISLWTGVASAALLGLVWAYSWWYLASVVARLLGQQKIDSVDPGPGPTD